MAIDKVTLEILANHCAAAAESMAFTLYRTAHSTFVKETEDFTTGLTTPDGQTFATPTDLGATWFVGLNYGNVIAAIEDYQEGDICLTNDPYSGFVCTHPPDLHLWMPIFHEGELVAFSANTAHHVDIGAGVPGGVIVDVPDVYAEGMLFTGIKLYEEGKRNEAIWQMIEN